MDERKPRISDRGVDLIDAMLRARPVPSGNLGHHADYTEPIRAMRALHEYIASLEADKRRLDYAVKHFICLDFAYDAGGEATESVAVIGLPATGRYGSDLRQTVDSAILNTGETKP